MCQICIEDSDSDLDAENSVLDLYSVAEDSVLDTDSDAKDSDLVLDSERVDATTTMQTMYIYSKKSKKVRR